MARVSRKAATYPPEFLQIIMHVINTQKELFISSPKIGTDRAAYTTFRARLSAFRKTNFDEAKEKGDKAMIDQAELLYSVTFSEPEQRNGMWGLPLRVKEQRYADALSEYLPSIPSVMEQEPVKKPDLSNEGTRTITDLFGKD